MSLFSDFGNFLFGVNGPSSAPYTADAQAAQAAAKQYAAREQSDYNNETALGDSLWRTVNGTAPSAADIQLQQTLGQNLNNGLAMGAGATGANAVLARYLASQATGNQGAMFAQAAALQRAKEVSDAQARLSGLYGNMESASSGLYGENTNAGLGYSNLANQVDQSNAQRQQQAEAAGLQFLSGVGSMYFGGQPKAAGAPTYSAGGNNAAFWSNPVNSAYRSAYTASTNAGA